MKETWRKEKESQELHNLLLILDLLDLDHSEPETHQEKVCTTLLEQSQLSGAGSSPQLHSCFILGTNLVLGPPEKFHHRNPSGTFRDTHWYHLDNPKKVPGAPSKGFLIFFDFRFDF